MGMAELVRFGVAMERQLLGRFDEVIEQRGYANRSEALRDLVRADLTRAAWNEGALVAATLTLVYDNDVRELVTRMADTEAAHPGLLTSSLRVPLGPERTLEVMVVRGAAAELSTFTGHLAGTKGVLSCELTLAASLLESELGRGARPRPAFDRTGEPKP